jgi:hypothetical protein
VHRQACSHGGGQCHARQEIGLESGCHDVLSGVFDEEG